MPFVVLLAALACGEHGAAGQTDCRRYRPAEAKRTFDGRVGSIAFRNGSQRAVEVRVYHPDGDGSVEASWTISANADSSLSGGFGNDWGIQVDGSCVATLGRATRWSPGQFAATWTGDSLVPSSVVLLIEHTPERGKGK